MPLSRHNEGRVTEIFTGVLWMTDRMIYSEVDGREMTFGEDFKAFWKTVFLVM